MLYSLQALRAFAAWVVVCHHFMQIFFDFHATARSANCSPTAAP
jgi:peptidoglycan/LPS O-acetylase OafA/YrhL